LRGLGNHPESSSGVNFNYKHGEKIGHVKITFAQVHTSIINIQSCSIYIKCNI
jgi:hypothetical protein